MVRTLLRRAEEAGCQVTRIDIVRDDYATIRDTVAQALADYREGRLTAAVAADVEGHW